MKDEVDRARMNGTTVEQAIKDFLKIMQLGRKALGKSPNLPSLKEAKAAYYRDRLKKPVRGSSF
jgi:hypothetical protein